MKRVPVLAPLLLLGTSCISQRDDAKTESSSVFTASAQPITSVFQIGGDTLSDSVRIHQLEPEPDGQSVAFLFADPAKGVTRGLGIVQASGGQQPQLVWPDSVGSMWWSSPHQLSFTAGTGRGVRVIVNAHAAQLEALDVTGSQGNSQPVEADSTSDSLRRSALARARQFIDSLRVQPQGTPQGSALRYEPDTVLVAPGDTLAAAYVSAGVAQGSKVNPAWYLIHLPTGQIQPIDSLVGRSSGLPISAAQWGANANFYYAKEQSIWRVQPSVK